MGFFKFLKPKKAGKKGETKNLDMPELPPLKESSFSQLPTFPETEKAEGLDLPPLEPLTLIEEEPKGLGQIKPKIEPIKHEPEPVFEPKPIREAMPFEEKSFEEETRPFEEEAEPSFESEPFEGLKEPVFVKAHEFREILESINKTKKSCRESRRIFTKLQESEKEENELFVKWHSALEDTQRRLVFIDNLIFER